LDSNFVYVHPPLAIAAYAFIFLFTALTFKAGFKAKTTKLLGLAAWILTLAGLVTGMFWAQIAWGSYWSWDIKEIFTLALFLALTATEITYFEGKQKATRLLLVVSCILVVVTAAASFLAAGVHSFL
jgi:ABC-type transport system involved in cytochrome c biogenesis permease subunit